MMRSFKQNSPAFNYRLWLIIAFCSCSQVSCENRRGNKLSYTETQTIYGSMRDEICNCTLRTMRENKPSTTFDSCYRVVMSKHTDDLIALGHDTALIGQNKLWSELRIDRCQDLMKLVQKESAALDTNKLFFKGQYLSQKKLPSGEYEITFLASDTDQETIFKSKFPFNEDQVKNYLPGYELTIEYAKVNNPRTNKEELYLKENAVVGAVGAVPVTQ